MRSDEREAKGLAAHFSAPLAMNCHLCCGMLTTRIHTRERPMTRRTTGFTRRDAIARFGVALAATTFPSRLLHAAENLRFREDPFTLGVASGYPGPDTVVLWTRLAPSPLQPGGGVPHDAVIPVTWEIAADERMRNVVRSGVDYATPQWAHSIHAEPAGLEARPRLLVSLHCRRPTKPDRAHAHRAARATLRTRGCASPSLRVSSTSMATSSVIDTCSRTNWI